MIQVRRLTLLLAIASLPLLAGCSSSATSGPPPAPSQTRLYVSNGVTSGGSTLAFALPITLTSSLIGGLVTSNGPLSLCVNGSVSGSKGALFVVQYSATNTMASPTLLAFAQPIAIAASPSFTIDVGTFPTGCVFDSTGNLYVARAPSAGSAITVIQGPVMSVSVPTTPITTGVFFPGGVTVDGNDDVFVCNQRNITEYMPLASGNTLKATFGSVFSASGCAIGPDGNLYVANGTSDGEIDVYKGPNFTNASSVDHSIAPLSATNIFDIKFDAKANMYVAADTTTDSAVYVIPSPYMAASALKFTPNPGGGDDQVRGLALTN